MDTFFEANVALSLFCKNYMDLKRGCPSGPVRWGCSTLSQDGPAPHTPVMVAQMLGVSKPMITALLTALALVESVHKYNRKVFIMSIYKLITYETMSHIVVAHLFISRRLTNSFVSRILLLG